MEGLVSDMTDALHAHLASASVQIAIRRWRLQIVGVPRPAQELGFVGVAYRLVVDECLMVDNEGTPIVVVTQPVSLN